MNLFLKITLSLLCLIMVPYLTLQAQDCNCEDSFKKTVDVYEKDYSLFIYKVTDENRDLYTAHTDIMRTKAMQTDNLQDCKTILVQWLDFFRDGHTYLKISTSIDLDIEKIPISEKEFKSSYKRNEYKQNPLLGIWQYKGYEVAIIPNPKNKNQTRDFVGLVINSSNEDWNQGDVKFELTSDFGSNYKSTFMMGDHTPKTVKAYQLSESKLSFENLNEWTKIWPKTSSEVSESEIVEKFGQFHFTEIDGIPYLRFPDFYSVDELHVDSIMKANHEKLLASEFIIVDIRENGGGNDVTYYPLLPYILSGPIQIPNTGLWMSDGNIKKFFESSDLKGKSIDEYTAEERELYDYVMSLKGTAFFEDPNYFYEYEPDTIYTSPMKVILLSTEAGSSGETFVYRANQSDKVVVYGQNTAGVVDGFNGLSTDIGCFTLTYPSSFRAKDVNENPIDPYGIAPDVYVDEDVDVLAYSIQHMKQLIKNVNSKK